MNPDETLTRLDQLIEAHSILRHPFYQAWQRGELTREHLATYARIYYPHVASFPCHIQSALDRTDDDVIRAELARNLEDELSNPKAHPELWLDFAEGLGLDRATIAKLAMRPAAFHIVNTFDQLSKKSTSEALAALYAYESQQPEVSRSKCDGLGRHYGIDDQRTTAYFEVHAEADVQHRAGERAALARCLENGARPEEILDAAEAALDAYWGLLDGVCEEAGICCQEYMCASSTGMGAVQ